MDAIQQIYGSDRNTYELPLDFHEDVWLVDPLHPDESRERAAPISRGSVGSVEALQ